MSFGPKRPSLLPSHNLMPLAKFLLRGPPKQKYNTRCQVVLGTTVGTCLHAYMLCMLYITYSQDRTVPYCVFMMHVYTYVHMYICTVYVCMYLCMHVCMHACMHVSLYMGIYNMYIYIYMADSFATA